MNAADKARATALQFEAKKNSLSQVQSGDWKLTFTVSATDVPPALLSAAMGTRYQAVIVEIDDNEMPVEQPVDQSKKEDPHRLSRQAAMLCDQQRFQWFLCREYKDTWSVASEAHRHASDIAADCVRAICSVESRSEFDSNPAAGARWRDLKAEFEAWKIAA